MTTLAELHQVHDVARNKAERELVAAALAKFDRKKEVANQLGISPKRLAYLIKKHKL